MTRQPLRAIAVFAAFALCPLLSSRAAWSDGGPWGDSHDHGFLGGDPDQGNAVVKPGHLREAADREFKTDVSRRVREVLAEHNRLAELPAVQQMVAETQQRVDSGIKPYEHRQSWQWEFDAMGQIVDRVLLRDAVDFADFVHDHPHADLNEINNAEVKIHADNVRGFVAQNASVLARSAAHDMGAAGGTPPWGNPPNCQTRQCWHEFMHNKVMPALMHDPIVNLGRSAAQATLKQDGKSGGGSAPSGKDWGSSSNSNGGQADSSGEDATKAGAAQLLAASGGRALDAGNYSGAITYAHEALLLDPRSSKATAILHLASGRAGVPESTTASSRGGASAAGAAAGAASGAAAAGGQSYASAAAGLSNTTPGRLEADRLGRDARAAMALGDSNGALDSVNRGLALDPNNPALLNMRASIYARMREYGKALADANAGLALAPKNRVLLATKGFAQLRGGDTKGALATANSLLEEDPNSAFAYAMRAHAEGQMGERDAMMADLNRAAALDPAYKAVRDAAAKLQLPSDSDILFLFPGEAAPSGKTAAPAPSARGKRFGILVGLSALGGLLLALGLLGTVLEPVKNKITSAFTRLTRSGPSVGAGAGLSTPQPPSAAGHLPGLIRGQYEIARQIGAGGMGMVFEGTDRSLGRRVAIKKMREELRYDPRERARFVAEAKTVAALHHPNIVDIYAIAEDGEDVYLIFEYVDGRTVHDLLQGGRLAPDETARIVRASAGALDFAHERGVIHRDMKPSNVMLDGQGRVKVMDFGIARVAKDAMTRRSMTNTVSGTPPYMAPEQEQGRVRKESDVYALAVCAYEMLAGRLPFVGVGAGMLMNKVNMSYVPPSKEVGALPAALDPVFAKAFQADPDKRYATPSEFAAALAAALPDAARARA